MPIVIDTDAADPDLVTYAVSPDNKLTASLDVANNGVLLTGRYFPGSPAFIRFFRDGVPVRGGDPALAVGGTATAYDHEAAIGPASWTAQALYLGLDGGLSAGTPTGAVVLYLPDLTLGQDFYVKSIGNPSLSMRLTASGAEPTLTYTGRTTLNDVLGSPVLAGSWDVHTLAAREFTFQVEGSIDRDSLLALLDAGPVLVQSLAMYDIPDFYAITQDVAESYMLGGYDNRRLIRVLFQPIGRPGTAGSASTIPGKSYDQIAANYYSYANLLARPTYNDLLL